MMTTRRTAGRARTLPARYYTSPDVFRAEMERIISHRWLYSGRASRLAETGAFYLDAIDGESLIVLRDAAGELHAFFNVCRHRGTRLCTEPEGRYTRTITCPYHAWSYGLDGGLLGAPNMNEVAGFDRGDYPLHAAGIASMDGMIFLNLSQDPEPFQDAFSPLENRFAPWRLSDLSSVHRVVYDIRANWKLIFQNYSECYHCPTLHPALNRLTPYRNASNDLVEGPFLGGPMRLGDGNQSMTTTGRACASLLGGITGENRHRVYYYTIFPSMLLSLHPDYVLIHRIRPVATDRTEVTCEWLFHSDALSEPSFDPAGAIEFWSTTNDQDWRACELSQQGIASRVYTPGPYANLESMLAAWDREYLRALGEPDGADQPPAR